MKQIIRLSTILIVVVFLLSACGSKKDDPASPTGFLTEPGAFRYQDFLNGFLETEYGEYAFYSLSERQIIYYSETGKHEFHVLCNKPDCDHRSEDCNAYVGFAVGYYNNHIYYIYQDNIRNYYVLARMNMDGTGHEDVLDLPRIEDKVTGASIQSVSEDSAMFHNGFLYKLEYDFLTSKDNFTHIFFKINLDTKEITTMFDDFFALYLFEDAKIIEDTIYMKVSDKDPTNKYDPTIIRSYHIAKGNLESGEIEIIINDWPKYGGIPPVEKDGILYYHRPGVGYCEYDIASGVETVKLEADLSVSQTSYTDKYIFAREQTNIPGTDMEYYDYNWVFKVYNYDYECLNTIEAGDFINVPMFLYPSSDALYFSAAGDYSITHYAEISSIGTDDFKLIPVSNTPNSRSHGTSD